MIAAPKSQKTVLVVEDNPADLFLLRRVVQKLCGNVRFEFLRDGEEVVNYLSGEGRFANKDAYPDPSVILMDFHLPKLSGLEILDWIRQQLSCKKPRIVMWSDSEFGADFKRAKEAGAEMVLRRPSGIEALTGFLEGIIDMVDEGEHRAG